MDFAVIGWGELATVALGLGLGGAVGWTIGLVGLGAGVLVVPVLIVALGFSPTMAVGTATTFGALSKVYAVWEHARRGNIEWRLSATVLLGALPVTAGLAAFVKHHAGSASLQRGLGVAIAVVIVVAAFLMLLRALGRGPAPLPPGRGPDRLEMGPGRMLRAVAAGALIGALIATTSASGVILVPVLVFGFPMAMRRVVGSSILITSLIALLAGGIYMLSGPGPEGDLPTAAWMVAGSFAGVRSGSRMATRFSERQLLLATVLMIWVAAAAMLGQLVWT